MPGRSRMRLDIAGRDAVRSEPLSLALDPLALCVSAAFRRLNLLHLLASSLAVLAVIYDPPTPLTVLGVEQHEPPTLLAEATAVGVRLLELGDCLLQQIERPSSES